MQRSRDFLLHMLTQVWCPRQFSANTRWHLCAVVVEVCNNGAEMSVRCATFCVQTRSRAKQPRRIYSVHSSVVRVKSAARVCMIPARHCWHKRKAPLRGRLTVHARTDTQYAHHRYTALIETISLPCESLQVQAIMFHGVSHRNTMTFRCQAKHPAGRVASQIASKTISRNISRQ